MSGETALKQVHAIRNIREKRDLAPSDTLRYTLDAHEAAVYRIS